MCLDKAGNTSSFFIYIGTWRNEGIVHYGGGMRAFNRFLSNPQEWNHSSDWPAKRRSSPSLYHFFKLSKLAPPGSINPKQRPGAEWLFFPSLPSGQWIYRGSNNCQAKCLVKWRTEASGGGVFITVLTLWLPCRELFCHKLEQRCKSIRGKPLSARLPASIAFPTAT